MLSVSISISLIEWFCRFPFVQRPRFLAATVSECPSDEQLHRDVVLIEVRESFHKWVHLRCPKCNEHIQLPLAGKQRWIIKVDFFRRPTLHPSIWEKRSCGAHFFLSRGAIHWCN